MSTPPIFSSILLVCVLLTAACSKVAQTQVEQKDIIDAVFASGFIVTEDEYVAMANAEGQILRQLVKEGDSVSPGVSLFVLSDEVQSAQLATAQANYQDALRKADPTSPQMVDLQLKIDQADIQLSQDQKNYERYSQLVETNAVSRMEFEQVKLQYEASQNNLDRLKQSQADLTNSQQLALENAKQQLKIQQKNSEDYVISSAIEGVVLQLFKKQGELVRRGEALARIGGGKALIKLSIAEEDINLIDVGQTAYVALNTSKDDIHEARVSKIYPAFDEQQQSFTVEATFIHTPSPLYAGTRLQANIVIGQKEHALVIPAAFLLPGDTVLLADQSKQAIKVGMRTNEWVEITSGLEQGNTVVSNP